MIVHGGTSKINSVAFSPDGNCVVSGSSDGTVRMWNAHNAYSIGVALEGHTYSVQSLAYSPLGRIIASASFDRTIRLWDVNTRQQLGQSIECNRAFHSVAFSPDAKLIASGCTSGSSAYNRGPAVQLWDVEKRAAASKPFKGQTGDIKSVQFSPDGSRLVSGSWKTVRVWDVESGTTIVGPLKGHTDEIISCSYDRTLRLWDARKGVMIGNPFEGHTHDIHSVAFSPCDTYVVSGGADKTVRLWDIRTCREIQSFDEHA
ncbi:unnamed protein product, partial [Rhizoctonia solani]